MSKVFAGDIGTVILLNTGTSLAGATVTKMRVRKPDGTIVEWQATVQDTTYLKFVTVAGTLDTAGRWQVQAQVTLPAWSGYGEVAYFNVSPILS